MVKIAAPLVPSMDPAGIQEFTSTLTTSSCYLEYGCGGSTLFAARFQNIKKIITVETDLSWLSAVRNSLSPDGQGRFVFLHADLGPVGDWGYPEAPSENYKSFWRYICDPWIECKAAGAEPDAVLVDGRFRVACAILSSMLMTRGVIMLDDYVGRPHYQEVERFLGRPRLAGRMAVFNVSSSTPASAASLGALLKFAIETA